MGDFRRVLIWVRRGGNCNVFPGIRDGCHDKIDTKNKKYFSLIHNEAMNNWNIGNIDGNHTDHIQVHLG